MDLVRYIGFKVKITLLNNYYFIGVVTSADENSLDLLDMNNSQVSLRKESILTIREICSR